MPDTLHAVIRELDASDTNDKHVYAPVVEQTQTKALEVHTYFSEKNIQIVKVVCGYQSATFLASSGQMYVLHQDAISCCSPSNVEDIAMCQDYLSYRVGRSVYQLNLDAQESTSILSNAPEDILQLSCDFYQTHLIRTASTLYQITSTTRQQHQLESITNGTVIDMAAGESHILLLTSDGRVFSRGSRTYGACGREQDTDQWGQVTFPNNEKVAKIAAGTKYSFCLIRDRLAYSFGINNLRQLGIGKYFFSTNTPYRVDLSKIRGSIQKFYCGGCNTLMKTTAGYYGVGNFPNTNFLFIDRNHCPKDWEKCDQPFACDVSKFSVALGQYIMIAYTKNLVNIPTVPSKSYETFKDVEIKCWN